MPEGMPQNQKAPNDGIFKSSIQGTFKNNATNLIKS
jgi:hypothetical protein